jgi:hypothetical protein
MPQKASPWWTGLMLQTNAGIDCFGLRCDDNVTINQLRSQLHRDDLNADND